MKAKSARAATVGLLAVLLATAACEGSFISVGDRWHAPRIDEAYAARDACLSRQAAQEAVVPAEADAAARAVAQACAGQTEDLVRISNRDGDVKVAENIRANSESRALRYVLQARARSAAPAAIAQGATASPPVR